MARPTSFLSQSYLDYSSEKSNVRLAVTTITAGNFAAQVTLHNALFAGLAGITLGREVKEVVQASEVITATLPPPSPDAQREKKWLLRYHDGAGAKFQAEVPCADLSLLVASGGLPGAADFIDQSGAAWIALKAAFEAVVVSPDDSSSVVLDSAQFVGRKG
jgi:hypothetical protein